MSYIHRLRPDIIINSAGYVGGINTVKNKQFDFFINNLSIDINILRACIQYPDISLLAFSSINAYGHMPERVIDESYLLTGKLNPSQEPYALAKGLTAKSIDFARTQFSLRSSAIVLEQLYGPSDHYLGEKAHMLPSAVRKVCDAVFNDAKSVSIWGSGNAKRSYTFAPDVAHFVVKNLLSILEENKTFNLGSNRYKTINEYYALIAARAKYKGCFFNDDTKPDVQDSVMISYDIAKKLGWSPVTSLTTGIDETIAYYRQHIMRG